MQIYVELHLYENLKKEFEEYEDWTDQILSKILQSKQYTTEFSFDLVEIVFRGEASSIRTPQVLKRNHDNLNKKFEDLGVSNRLLNNLKKNNIVYLKDYVECEKFNRSGFGRRQYCELKELFKELGLRSYF